MGAGWIASLIVAFVLTAVILAISIPFERKYIVKENGKTNYKKSTYYCIIIMI